MAVKRPEGLSAGPEVPDLQLVDDLVRRSLQVNPSLRNGMSTHDYLCKMRETLLAGHAPVAAAAPVSPASGGSLEARALALFMEKKTGEFEAGRDELAAAIAAIKRKESALVERTLDELCDFLQVVLAESKGAPSPALLTPYRALLSQLGVSEAELLRRALATKR